MTLAYAILNIMIYALWWYKPFNVQEPIDVRGRVSTPERARGFDGIKTILADFCVLLASGTRRSSVVRVMPAVGFVFGGIHCFAWWFPFPTYREQVLWRIGAVACTVTPFVLAAVPAERIVVPCITGDDAGDLIEALCFLILMPLPLCFYVVCRVILVVLTFTSLRALPAGVFEATSWTSFFPHFE